MSADASTKVRLDSWLWAARFFKTRSLAKTAVEGGKVQVDGHKAKPGKTVTPGLILEISKESGTFVVEVQGLASKRKPASEAEKLYQETEASREKREQEAANRRAAGRPPTPNHRPDKRDRRALRRLREHGD